MGELNLDKFERAWCQVSEQRPIRAMYSVKEEETVSRCSSAVQNEITKLDRESRRSTQWAYGIKKLHRHFVVV